MSGFPITPISRRDALEDALHEHQWRLEPPPTRPNPAARLNNITFVDLKRSRCEDDHPGRDSMPAHPTTKKTSRNGFFLMTPSEFIDDQRPPHHPKLLTPSPRKSDVKATGSSPSSLLDVAKVQSSDFLPIVDGVESSLPSPPRNFKVPKLPPKRLAWDEMMTL